MNFNNSYKSYCWVFLLIVSFLISLFIFPTNLYSQSQDSGGPYAWPFFPPGDGQGGLNLKPHLSNLLGSFVFSSTPDERGAGEQLEVALTSFTWGGSSDHGNPPLDGFGRNNDGAMNYIANQGYANRLFPTGDADNLDGFLEWANTAVGNRASFVDGEQISHKKVLTRQDDAVIFGTGNFTYGGYSMNHEAWLLVNNDDRWAGDEFAGAFHNKLKEMHAGTNWVDGRSPIFLDGPNGEEIGIYFWPDVSPGVNIADMIADEIRGANQSVQYLINVYTDGVGTRPIEEAKAAVSGDILVEGIVADNARSTQDSILQRLEQDHGMRRWSTGAATSSHKLHHKTMIIDQEKIIFGSANYTNPAMYRPPEDVADSCNQEVVVTIDDFRLARRFMGEYNRVMSKADPSVGGNDTFKDEDPLGVSEFTAKDIPGQDNSLQLTWEGLDDPEDITRYYVFATDYPISTNEDVCDFKDTNNSGSPCDDPVFDVTGFRAGANKGSLSLLDNNADGSEGGDPFEFPEKQVLIDDYDPGTAILDTFNYGGLLPNNTDLWVGIVAVDAHGNESTLIVEGPVQSLPGEPGAEPEFALSFADDASDIVGRESQIEIVVSNQQEAAESIVEWSADLQDMDNSFQLQANQSAPAGWDVQIDGTKITFTSLTSADYIAAGESEVFYINVINPSYPGESAGIIGSTRDSNDAEIPTITIGSLEIKSEEEVFGIVSHEVSDGINTISEFDGSQRLLDTDALVTIEFDTFVEEDLKIHYRVNSEPDGSEIDNITQAHPVDETRTAFEVVISSDVIDYSHGGEVYYMFVVNETKFDNGGLFYRYEIDGHVSDPGDLTVQRVAPTSVVLNFEPIVDADFERYEIFYSTASPATADDQMFTFENKDPGTEGVEITGLSEETTYYFNIRAVDDIGNKSELYAEDEVAATTTRDISFLLDRAEDGVNTVTDFDGSGLVRLSDVAVYWNTEEELSSDDVALYYDFKEDSNTVFTGLSGYTKRIPLGSGTDFRAIIPSSASGFEGGKFVAFVLKIEENILHHPTGRPFLLYIDEGEEQSVENFSVSNIDAGEISFSWTSIPSTEDFGTYRIYYSDTTPVGTGAETWDKTNDQTLGYMSTTGTTISGLTPDRTYYFRIAVVNDNGSVGPLSEELEEATVTTGSVLISEVNFDTSTGYSPYIELTAVEGPVDISGFELDDLNGGATGNLAGSSIVLERGDRAVVHLLGSQETGAAADIYVDEMQSVYNNQPGIIVLYDGASDTLDALVYRPTASDDINGKVGLLEPEYWATADSSGAVVTYAQGAEDLDDTPVAGRLRDRRGNLKNTSSKSDWEVTTTARPGRESRFLEIVSIEVSDSPSGPTHFRAQNVDGFTGSGALKATQERVVEVSFNQSPVQRQGVYFWYDQDDNPGGLANTAEGDSFALTYNSRTRIAVGVGQIDGDTHGAEKRTMVTVHNVKTGATEYDEMRFDRRGRFYSYYLDNKPLPTISNADYARVESGEVLIYWSVYSDELAGDFEEYRIFYDTGTVNTTSLSIGRDDYEVLGDIGRQWLRMPVDAYNDTWNFRVGAVDRRGNITDVTGTADLTGVAEVGEFSDTVSVYVPRPIELRSLSARDGKNTVDLRRNPASGLLTDTEVTIEAEFDRETDTAILHYNTTPETPANPNTGDDTQVTMTHQGRGVYTAEIPAYEHDTTLTLGIQTDGEPKYRRGDAYRYKVHAIAEPEISDFKYVLRFTNNNPVLYVYWSALDSEGPEFEELFGEYQILIDNNLEAPFQDDFIIQDSTDRSNLSEPGTQYSVYRDLDTSETYVVAVRWQDRIKNISPLSDTHQISVIVGQPAEDPVWDGTSWATELDGSEYLQGGVDYMVHFEFEETPPQPDSTYLEYNALEAGQQPFSGVGVVDTIPLEHLEDLIWEGFMKQNDPGIAEAEQIAYQVHSGNNFYDNGGAFYRFNIDHNPVNELEGVSITDRDDVIYISWSTVNRDDFKTYRVRYRKTTQAEWTVVDKENEEALGDMSRQYLRLEVDPGANYYWNVTVVDRAEHTAYQPADNYLLRDPDAGVPEFAAASSQVLGLSEGEQAVVKTYLEDLSDSPWYGEAVSFSSTEVGIVFENGENSLQTQTDPAGYAQTLLTIDGAAPGYHTVVARWDNKYFTEEINFTIRVFDDEEKQRGTKVVPFE